MIKNDNLELKQVIKTKQDLLNYLKNGATIITPNNRLSQQLLVDHMDKSTSSVSAKPSCLSYSAFLIHLFVELQHQLAHFTHPVVLTPWQQRHLWHTIVSQSGDYTLNNGLLNAVQDAWSRCQNALVDTEDPRFNLTPQSRRFQSWQRNFKNELTLHNLLAQEQLASYLIQKIKHLKPRELIWVCFDDFTPQQKFLQAALNQTGFVQYQYDISSKLSTSFKYGARDQNEEYLQMILWVKQQHDLGHQRIGVVIPDLASQERSLQRLLSHHLPTEYFNISLGKALDTYPLIAHAIEWLQLNNRLTHHQVRLLLTSPYLIGSKSEFIARAEILHSHESLADLDISMFQFIEACGSEAPQLAAVLKKMDDYPDNASVSEWVGYFKLRLSQLEFPGPYTLNSSAYQCLQRLLALFDEFLQLHVVSSSLTKTEAIRALLDGACHTIFQMQKTATPIQFLGLLEASGCEFDCVWMSGLTDQCLPQKTKFSAFIPVDLQREYHMPHTCAESELNYARQHIKRLQNNSMHSIFSYPELVGDTPILSSPLIKSLPSWSPFLLDTSTAFNHLIPYKDEYNIPFMQQECIRGGTSALANQAKCPFRAFAAHRLHASLPLDPTSGPNASERGQVMHRIMEFLWAQLKTQQRLKTLSSEALHQLIEAAVTFGLKELIHKQKSSFTPLMLEVEMKRLSELVNACLEWELTRPQFEIQALEETYHLNLAGLEFRVRIDRLDRILNKDEKWVIDYKTSIPAQKPWFEERPEAPQLLLYALLDEAISTLLFVQLKAGQIVCNGLSANSEDIPGINSIRRGEEWHELRQQWQNDLTKLALEIQTGHCPPHPTKSSTCEQCDFRSLCRIDSLPVAQQ